MKMVDISPKQPTKRYAIATARVTMEPATLKAIGQNKIPKGDVLAGSKLAAITAAKKTSDLLPLCHPLALEAVKVDIKLEPPNKVSISVYCANYGKTGPEMEALTAATVAALNVYDMCKGIDSTMDIATCLVEKAGGKSSP